jgi:hypothetical protein
MRRTVGALAGLCLLTGTALTWVEADGRAPGIAPGHTPPSAQIGPAPARVDATALVNQILARPLFTPTRRPYVAARVAKTPAVPTAPVPEPAGTLLGTAIGPTQRLALFRRSGSGETVSLTVGEALDRWVVTEINLGSVTLHADTGENRVMPIERSLGVVPPIKLQLPPFHNEV